MPDNEDYAALGQLLSAPETWTTEEVASARALLRAQQDAVASVHPKDAARRAAMQQVVEDLRVAIATWEQRSG